MAVDMFLKLDGIKGESKDDKHAGEIQIESFSWGLSQVGSMGVGGGGGAGKVSVHDISVVKAVDSATCALMLHCANGKHIPNGLLTVRKAGEKPLEYMKIKLQDILVSGVTNAGHGGESISEQVSLNFAKVNVDYQVQEKDGTGKPAGAFGWDVKANVKL